MFVFEKDVIWDEVMKFIPRGGIYLVDRYVYAVFLSGYRALIGDNISD